MLLEFDKVHPAPALDWTGFNRLPAEEELRDDARLFVSAASVLVRHLDLALVSITCEREAQFPVSVRPWTHGPQILAPLEAAAFAAPPLQKAHALLSRHARRLCAALSARWPSTACPPLVGLVSDGRGVAISQDHPSALDPLWLMEHVSGEAPASAILPFDATEAWLRLSGTERGQQH